MTNYSLFWHEDRGDYDLRCGDRVIGRLPDGDLPHMVLMALSDQKELAKTKDALRAIRHYAIEIVRLIDEVDP